MLGGFLYTCIWEAKRFAKPAINKTELGDWVGREAAMDLASSQLQEKQALVSSKTNSLKQYNSTNSLNQPFPASPLW